MEIVVQIIRLLGREAMSLSRVEFFLIEELVDYAMRTGAPSGRFCSYLCRLAMRNNGSRVFVGLHFCQPSTQKHTRGRCAETSPLCYSESGTGGGVSATSLSTSGTFSASCQSDMPGFQT